MNNDKIQKILSEAKQAYEPTAADKDRVYEKVLIAVGGVAGGLTAGGAAAAGHSSLAGKSFFIKYGSLLKLSLLGVLLGGIVVTTSVVDKNGFETISDQEAGSSIYDTAYNEHSDLLPLVSPSTRFPSRIPYIMEEQANESVDETEAESQKSPSRFSVLAPKQQPKPETTEVPESGSQDDGILEEIQMIRRASVALNNNAIVQAIGILGEHQQRFPNGVMKQEREGLRVIALCKQGKIVEGKKAQERFKKRSPSSPINVRIKKACVSGE